jgi:hypothetical protein
MLLSELAPLVNAQQGVILSWSRRRMADSGLQLLAAYADFRSMATRAARASAKG